MMSVERQVAMLVCGLCLGTVAIADEQPERTPEVEFLEYLGMWEQTDEEWLLHDVEETAVLEERSEPVPEGEVSTEIEDEG
jgi:hypothetical protein